MENIYVFSTFRSGTNLFAALLNNNKEILSINANGFKHTDNVEELYIYTSEALKKDKKVKYVLYDEVHISNFYNVEGKRILLLRNPFGVIDSRIRMRNKLGGNKGVVKIAYKLARYMDVSLKPYKEYDAVVFVEEFISRLSLEYHKLFANWGIQSIDDNIDFYKTFSDYEIVDVEEVNEDNFSLANSDEITLYRPGPYFRDKASGQLVYGHGGFNPCQKISVDRLNAWQDNMSGKLKMIIFDELKKTLDQEIVDNYLKQDIQTVKRLVEEKYG